MIPQAGQVEPRTEFPVNPAATTGFRAAWPHVIAISTILCLLNAAKPLVVDDTAYHAFAAQIAGEPLDPYGFSIFWYQRPEPAHGVLAPPVFCYWWALGIRLFGDQPLLWKLWLWPWLVLFVSSVLALCRRVAAPVAVSLTWFIACSPTILPAINLMLDIPTLALSLTAIEQFLRALDSRSWARAIGAGLLAGLAAQTKYTAMLTPVVFLLAAWQAPRWPRGWAIGQAILAIAFAVGVFGSWEGLMAWNYGSSHFLEHASKLHQPWARKLLLTWPLVGILGSAAAPLLLLGLTALKVLRRTMLVVAGVIGLSWAAVIRSPADAVLTIPGSGNAGWTVSNLAFGWMGGLTLTLLAWLTICSLTDRRAERASRFVAAWWLLELAGYFMLSPWPAVRRIIGLVLVSALLVGRALGPDPSPLSRRRLKWVVASSIGFGVGYQAIDTCDAIAERTAVERTTARLREQKPDAEIWYVGHWGLQFHANRAGWHMVIPDQSLLSAGSWLVVPPPGYRQQEIEIPSTAVEWDTLGFATPWRLHTIPAYYGKNKAIEAWDGPAIWLRVYRMAEPATPWTALAADGRRPEP